MRQAGFGVIGGMAALLAAAAPIPALAQDEALRPSAGSPFGTRDAFTQDRGTVQLEGFFTYERERGGADGFELQPGIKYGLTDSIELSLDAAYTLGDASGADSGAVTPEVTWRLFEGEGWRPSVALLGAVDIPFGAGEDSARTELTAIASWTTGRGPGAFGLHLNAGWLAHPDAVAEERRNGYRFAGAISHVVDADTILVAGYVQETQDRDERDLSMVEAGIGRRVGGVDVSLVAGAGLNDDSPRFRIVAGLKFEFSLSGR